MFVDLQERARREAIEECLRQEGNTGTRGHLRKDWIEHAIRLEAIASRLDAIATRLEPSLAGWRPSPLKLLSLFYTKFRRLLLD